MVSLPKNISLVAGKSAKLLCQANGSPEPDVEWKEKGDSRIIELDPVTTKDAGVYTCYASNSLGEDWKNVTITVECK